MTARRSSIRESVMATGATAWTVSMRVPAASGHDTLETFALVEAAYRATPGAILASDRQEAAVDRQTMAGRHRGTHPAKTAGRGYLCDGGVLWIASVVCQAAWARAAPGRLAFQFQGSSSSRRLAGWSGSRARTSASQA